MPVVSRSIQCLIPGITRPKPKSTHAVADIAQMLVLQASWQRWEWRDKEAWEAPRTPSRDSSQSTAASHDKEDGEDTDADSKSVPDY